MIKKYNILLLCLIVFLVNTEYVLVNKMSCDLISDRELITLNCTGELSSPGDVDFEVYSGIVQSATCYNKNNVVCEGKVSLGSISGLNQILYCYRLNQTDGYFYPGSYTRTCSILNIYVNDTGTHEVIFPSDLISKKYYNEVLTNCKNQIKTNFTNKLILNIFLVLLLIISLF